MQHDRDIREPLFIWLEETFGKVRILEEKTMGRSRADIAMVTENGLAGIEIKSDADDYARLARQVRDYDRYFDWNILVSGMRHMQHIEEHIPAYWGILAAESLEDQTLDFYLARKPGPNPNVSVEHKLSLLWRRELAHLLSVNGLPAYAAKSKRYVAACLAERIPAGRLKRQICQELFERDYTTIEEEIREFREEHGRRDKKRKRKKKQKD